MTAYMGCRKSANPSLARLPVVAAAPRAVGSVGAGEIARIKGARAVGIAGGNPTNAVT